MFIVVTGNPWIGFTACGPFDTEEECDIAGDIARVTYADSNCDWYGMDLRQSASARQSHTAKEWRTMKEAWVRFSGDITEPWKFVGPFEQNRVELGGFLQLQPLDEDDLTESLKEAAA
jgi:hypothetical protein